MEANARPFSFLMTSSYYEVPFFQRSYVWNEDNWSDLLDSLREVQNGLFLGSIILKQVQTCSGEIPRYMIIDGQQRLTTLSILLKACYESICTNHPSDFSRDTLDDYKKTYLDMCFVKETNRREVKRKIKLRHARSDADAFMHVINVDNILNINNRTSTDRLEGHKISKAYVFFIEALRDYSSDELEHLWNILTDNTINCHKILVNIDLSIDDNEQAIFDAINSSGVRLTCADTIKNALFQKMIELSPDTESVYQLYHEEWASVFLDESYIEFWNKEILSGRIKRDNLEVLLHCIAVVNGFFNPEEEKLINLADCYKKHMNEQSETALRHFIEEIHDYAIEYMEKMQIKKTTQFNYCNQLQRLLCVCENLQISAFAPYILYLIKKQDIDENDRNTKFFELGRYIVLHAICGATTKNYNKECVQFIKGSTTPNDMLRNDTDIREDSFLDTLTKIKNDLAKLLLFWCELYRRNNSNADKELKYNYELEHIMPQSWEENWSVTDVPVKDENNNEIQDLEEATRKRSVSIYKIGNMTLLNSSLNKQLRNSSFLDKLNGQGRKKGIKDLADCLLTRDLVSFSSWDESNISQRTNELINLISIVWDIHWDNEGRFVVNN